MFPISQQNAVKYLPPSSATIKGHLNCIPKNFRLSSKQQQEITLEEDLHSQADTNAVCKLFCFVTLADTNIGTIYIDLTKNYLYNHFMDINTSSVHTCMTTTQY